MAKTIVFFILLLLATSCDKKKLTIELRDGDPDLARVSLVVKNKCLTCHQDYDYGSNQAWIDSGLIVPGSLKKSIFFSSIRGTGVSGSENMPPLHSESVLPHEIETIKTWIKNLKEINKPNLKTKISFLHKRMDKKTLLRRCISQMAQKYYRKLPFATCDEAVDSLKVEMGKQVEKGFPRVALRNFQFLHNSFFTEANFNKNNENWGTFELFDPSETAYGFTASLFVPRLKFRSLFQGNSIIGAYRIKEGESEYLVSRRDDVEFLPKDRFDWLNGDDSDKPEKWEPSPESVERGALVGFRALSGNRNLIFKAYKNSEERDSVSGTFPIHKGFGGGILGSTSYSILNYSNNFLQVMDSENKTMRSWSKAVFRDLMCRSLPVLTIYDAHSHTKKDSSLPFQRSASCMQCHLSIDPTAKALSFVSMGHNNIIAQKIDLESKEVGALQSIIPFDVRKSSLEGKYKTNEMGKMSYRNYTGELRELEFKNIDELGKKMLDELDPYICFSKRYLEYFFDLNINLDELIAKKNTHTAIERYIYNELITFGKTLKKTQSPKKLLKDIFAHDIYQFGFENLKAEYSQ